MATLVQFILCCDETDISNAHRTIEEILAGNHATNVYRYDEQLRLKHNVVLLPTLEPKLCESKTIYSSIPLWLSLSSLCFFFVGLCLCVIAMFAVPFPDSLSPEASNGLMIASAVLCGVCFIPLICTYEAYRMRCLLLDLDFWLPIVSLGGLMASYGYLYVHVTQASVAATAACLTVFVVTVGTLVFGADAAQFSHKYRFLLNLVLLLASLTFTVFCLVRVLNVLYPASKVSNAFVETISVDFSVTTIQALVVSNSLTLVSYFGRMLYRLQRVWRKGQDCYCVLRMPVDDYIVLGYDETTHESQSLACHYFYIRFTTTTTPTITEDVVRDVVIANILTVQRLQISCTQYSGNNVTAVMGLMHPMVFDGTPFLASPKVFWWSFKHISILQFCVVIACWSIFYMWISCVFAYGVAPRTPASVYLLIISLFGQIPIFCMMQRGLLVEFYKTYEIITLSIITVGFCVSVTMFFDLMLHDIVPTAAYYVFSFTNIAGNNLIYATEALPISTNIRRSMSLNMFWVLLFITLATTPSVIQYYKPEVRKALYTEIDFGFTTTTLQNLIFMPMWGTFVANLKTTVKNLLGYRYSTLTAAPIDVVLRKADTVIRSTEEPY